MELFDYHHINQPLEMTGIIGCSRIELVDYIEWLIQDDFKSLTNFVHSELGIHTSNNSESIAQSIFYTSLEQYEKKLQEKNYYWQNGICLTNTIRDLFTSELLETLLKSDTPQYTVNNFSSILQQLFSDMELLINSYHVIKNKEDPKFGIWKNPVVHPRTVLDNVDIACFGYPRNGHIDIDFAISAIRQTIELRIRNAVQIFLLEDDSGKSHTIGLTKLFDELAKHVKDFGFSCVCDIRNVQKIYSWANLFLHGGLRDYTWKPYFARKYIWPLICGVKKNDDWSVDNGLILSGDILHSIHENLKNQLQKDN